MNGGGMTFIVLILVLMEDALAHYSLQSVCNENLQRLNPCFNGRCTRTYKKFNNPTGLPLVLILVLMEDALAHRRNFKTEGGERS